VIDRGRIAQALAKHPFADWIVFERDQELAVRDGARGRTELRSRFRIVAHVDTPKGRGTARLAVDTVDADADQLADRAVALAIASVGDSWETPPAAAPARVELADPAFDDDLDAIADRVLHAVAARNAVIGVTLLRERVASISRSGFHAEWRATLARASALVIADARSLLIEREARQLDALDISAAIADATSDLHALARAPAATAGPCSAILTADALVPDDLGVWAAFAAQADARLASEGLSRFRENLPIVAGADQMPDPLTITSDGALAFGVRSAPLGDDGDAVRRFAIVDRGLAGTLGLSPREASLRKLDPNGGVRNLVVRPGTWNGQADPSGRLVEIRRLRSLAIDPYSGDASLEIALGIEHGKGPFTGGTLRLDLIEALARARRSSARMRRGAYDGPSSVLIEKAELLV
jgi:predicted Zn-dependent protease